MCIDFCLLSDHSCPKARFSNHLHLQRRHLQNISWDLSWAGVGWGPGRCSFLKFPRWLVSTFKIWTLLYGNEKSLVIGIYCWRWFGKKYAAVMWMYILYFINSFISWFKNSRHSPFNLASKFWGTSSHRSRHVHTRSHFAPSFMGIYGCALYLRNPSPDGNYFKGKGKAKAQVIKEEQGIGIQTTLPVEQRWKSGGVDGLKCCCMPLAT